jgi:streptomycin 6-kinase
VLTRRWALSNAKLLVKNKRSTVFKVDSPMGPAALKLYNEIGYANERSAVAFSNNLREGIGAQMLRSDYFRAAILVEWLSGPTLEETYHNGGYEDATRHACEIARKISTVQFRWPITYRRLMPLMKRRFQTQLGKNKNTEHQQLVQQAITLLDKQFGAPRSEQIIHGDLHYGNIILTPQGVRAIDPKGVRAHPMLEVRNVFTAPKSENGLEEFTDRLLHQVDIVAEELGYDHKALIQFNIFKTIEGMLKPTVSAEESNHLSQRLDVLTREGA